MTHATADNLYKLLPAIYHLRDAEHGEVLKALLTVIAEQASVVEEDIARLYDNAFIETCDEWVVPYLGDLLGARPLHAVGSNSSLRAYVANTLAYRRRKGTAPVLEQLARDVTGWTARAVEFFQLLGTTQHVNHVRLHNVRTPNLRDTNALELIASPFEQAAHSAEVRHIDSQRGRYNLPNIGLFLWRLQPYTFTGGQDARVTARALVAPSDGRYTFNPLGYDTPLFNRPQTQTEITHLAEEINVPGRLRRRPLYDELAAPRQGLITTSTHRTAYFGITPVLEVFADGSSRPIMICDLSDLPASPPGEWPRPPDSQITVGVDPVLGRLAFPEGWTPNQVQVSYTYGFSADVGGGPYDRRVSVAQILASTVTWQVGVSQIAPNELFATLAGARQIAPDGLFTTLADAVQAWNAHAQPREDTVGAIVILDSLTYEEDLTGLNAITIPEGSQLVLMATDGRRPHVLGDIGVIGTAPADSQSPGELVLHGLLVEGRLGILAGELGSVKIVHSTLVPGIGGIVMESLASPPQQNSQLRISLERSICGPISLGESITSLHIVDSIVDGIGGRAITASGADGDISTSTVYGRASLRSLEASGSIFTDTLMVERRQTGCVRFSYVPEDSQTPRRYRCQPGLALKEVTNPAEQARIRARLRPSFTSTQYGQPAYTQLSLTCAEEVRTGAEDGSEMGVFSHLKQPQREANLRASLEEYLRLGLEAGFFFVT